MKLIAFIILICLGACMTSASAQQHNKTKNSKEAIDNRGRYHDDNDSDELNVMHPDGAWSYAVEGKTWASGFYKNNERDGEWKLYDAHGHLYFEGSYKNARMNGTWKYYNPDRSLRSTVTFLNGEMEGPVVTYFDNGKIRSAFTYHNYELDSLETTYYADGKIRSRIVYKNSQPSMILEMNDEHGNKLDYGNFVNGSGTLKTYFSDGQLNTEEYYANYRHEGLYVDYYHRGQKYAEGVSLGDSAIGIWTFYDSTGLYPKKVNYDADTTRENPIYGGSKEVAQFGVYMEQMPEFPGGISELIKFLQRNLQYPKEARKNGTEGRVVTQFVVNEDGRLSDITFEKTIGSGCEEEVMRILNAMPPWAPGLQNAVPVKVYFKLPVTFKM